MYYVVGSGPSGVAAAHALLSRGLPVTMLDVGRECESDRLVVAQRLARLDPKAWDPALVAQLRGPSPDLERPRKLCYGSDFSYAPDAQLTLEQQGTHCLHSSAKGGLSNVWGASVLPARAGDLRDWPLTLEAMSPHYAAVARLLDIAGAHDELETDFPYYAEPAAPLAPSRQAQHLLTHMRARRDRLARSGIVFGQSRLAVRTAESEQGSGCRYVGLCLTGCPYAAIWNAASLLPALAACGNFSYHGGVRVTAVESRAGTVRIHGVSVVDGKAQAWQGKAIFLACGPLPTSAIVVRSLNISDATLRLQYQPYFLLPLLTFHPERDIDSERLHTLTQLYLELTDTRVSAHPIHLQLYTYSHFIRERLTAILRFLPGPLGRGLRRLAEGRLLAIQGYLDSREGGGILLKVQGSTGHLKLCADSPSSDSRKVRRVVAALARRSLDIGALPLRPLLRVGLPGEGNHIGGTFPMRNAPRHLETNLLGQFAALPGVHLADASVLPSLPAASYTYTIMANAHRIASEVADRAGA